MEPQIPIVTLEKCKIDDRLSGARRMQEMGWKQLQLWLEPATFAKLKEWARIKGESATRLVRRLVDEAVANAEWISTAELARRAKAECENREW